MYESIYVHVPFCKAKCAYCAFYSEAGASAEVRRLWLSVIERELCAHMDYCGPIRSIFVGGGTPSLLEPDELENLFSVLSRVKITDNAEITVECNPASLTSEKIQAMLEAGVNRVNLGVQSFQETLRSRMGRASPLGEIECQLSELRETGISNVGVDLIYAIPGQTLDAWRNDVRRACEYGIYHLSTYELTWEEGTRLARGAARPTDEALAIEMWQATEEVAGEFGLQRYEVSNLAQPGRECAHNDAIWHGATYLGLGPAACSYDGIVRRTNPSDLYLWLGGAPPAIDELTADSRAAEILAFGLRTVRGWERTEFIQRTGFDYGALRPDELKSLEDEGLLASTDSSVHPTLDGLLFADHIAAVLL